MASAAGVAGVITVTDDGKTVSKDGTVVTRFGFHSFRHSLASTLMERGEDPALIQGLLRHSKLDMTLYYSDAQKAQKVAARCIALSISAKDGGGSVMTGARTGAWYGNGICRFSQYLSAQQDGWWAL
jgi:hypothetical protein